MIKIFRYQRSLQKYFAYYLVRCLCIRREAQPLESDFYGDSEIDVWGYYEIRGDTIVFKDMGGVPCDFEGIYQYKIENDTVRFHLIKDDECGGRVRGMEGDWIRKRLE